MSRLIDPPTPDQMVNLERSASDTELACDSLDPCIVSAELHRSMPDLSGSETSDEGHVPPNYYQMCIMDLIEISKAQQSKTNSVVEEKSPVSTVASDGSITSFFHHLVQEVAALREENFRLVATVLKNNEDIQSLLTKHQSVVGQLEELKSEQCKLQKQNYELEEKLQLNLKETKLLYSDIEQLQSQMRSIAPTRTFASEYNRSTSQTNQPIKASSALIGQAESGNRLLNRRIDELEVQLQCMSGQSLATCDRLDDCLRRLKHNESLKEQTEQQLNFMNNLNQLLQLKLLSLETKMQSKNQLGTKELPSPVYAIQSKYESLVERLKEFKQFACKVPVPPFMTTLPPVALEQGQQLPQDSLQHSTQTSESSESGTATTPTSPSIGTEHEPSFRNHSRRHHRIRLFPHRRRH